MTEDVIEVVETVEITPIRHQLGKLLFATLVTFAATALSEKLYDVGLAAYRRHQGN